MTINIYGDIDPADDSKMLIIAQGANDWQLDAIDRVMKIMTPSFERLKEPRFVWKVAKTWACVAQLGSVFQESQGSDEWGQGYKWVPSGELSKWIVDEIMRRASDDKPAGEDPARSPMSHQSAGAVAIGMNGTFLLADEMGPQPVDTPVKVPGGWAVLGDLKPGDKVYAKDGSETPVTEIKFFGSQPVYRVTFSDRTSTLVNGSHLWEVQTANHRFRGSGSYVLSTDQILEAGITQANGNSKFFLPPQPVINEGSVFGDSLPLNPYFYGALLGDGSLSGSSVSFTSADEDMLYRMSNEGKYIGTTVRREEAEGKCLALRYHRDGKLWNALDELDARHRAEDKFIDDRYLHAGAYSRWELLRGLLDTDGYVSDDKRSVVEFVSVSPELASQTAFLARSLGAVVTESEAQPATLNGVRHRDKYRVHMRFPANSPSPFWLRRKHDRWVALSARIQRKSPSRAIVSIVPEGEAEVCCIRIDHDSHVYLTDTALIPTHNTGKTQTVLMGLAELEKRDRNPFPAIVVCPAAVIDPWLEDIAEVYPQWRPFCTDYRGPNRRKWLDKNPDIKILVMSYETMRNDIGDSGKEGPLMKWAVKNANTVIYDEAHKLCNHDTKQSTRARRLAKKVSNVVMATGTPITKGTANFWPLLNGMEPGAFPNRERFKVRYTTDKRQEQYGDGQGLGGLDPLTEPEFRTVMQGTMRRVATADVLDLPEKTYQRRLIDIPAKWRAVYEEMEEDMIAHLPSEDEETALTAMTTLVKMMRLAQLANSACDLETIQELDDKPGSDTYGEMVEKIMVHPKEPCWKGDAMLEILAELHQDDRGSGIEHGHNPVVAFAPHKKLTRLCGKMAEAKGYRVGYIDGDVSGTQRTKYRLAFQDNELDLMMVSTGAGGTGLTLTAASTAIYLMRPWSYVESTQSEARIYRKGQTRHTQIIDLIARNSVESRVLESLRAKNANLAELVRDRRLVESFLGGGR